MTKPRELTRTPSEAETLRAAADIVAAFRTNNTVGYFAGFAHDASFVFHPEPRRLNSRSEYEQLWETWTAAGWSVVECRSSDQLAQVFPGGAVFSHTVQTTTGTDGDRESYTERETIVFRVEGDRLLAVHEHLSLPSTPAS
ncbi:YybH family protein [Leucobacter sp. Z1108]|uniref:YybH family protein n=1 Tax=Leucobacter sp. Z1108 TaxID=3439066 RepID=UPI003F2DD679